MRHHLSKMAWFAWITVVVLTVVFALLVTFLRIVTPMLQNYTEQIKSYLHQSIKHPVHIDEITSDWYGFGPVIEIKNLEIFDNDEKTVLLSASYARLRFSLIELIRHLSLVPASLSIEKGNITLNYAENKHWSVLGIGDDQTESAGSIFEWTPARQRINLNDFTIKINAYNGEQYEFDHANVLIADDGSNTNIQIGTDWVAPTQSKVTVIGEFDSRGLSNGLLEGRVYTYLSKVDWPSSSIFAPTLPADIKDGSGSIELWTDWSDGSLYKIQAELAWQDVIVKFKDVTSPLKVDSLKRIFVWLAPEKDQWVFLGDDVVLQTNKITTTPADFKWSHNINGDNDDTLKLKM